MTVDPKSFLEHVSSYEELLTWYEERRKEIDAAPAKLRPGLERMLQTAFRDNETRLRLPKSESS